MLVFLVAWTLFAFAGAYPWTTRPLIVGAFLLAAIVRPPIGRRETRLLDISLAACLVVVGFQVVPLAPRLLLALSPHAPGVEHVLWLDAPQDPLAGPPRPLSIDPDATGSALLLAVAFALVFWSARESFARGGIRVAARGVAWVGLALAGVATLQHATAPTLLYWVYPTIFGAPFGPYLNRSDFSTWLIMAIPVTVGYFLTRIESRILTSGGGVRLARAVDGTAVWLLGSTCLMSAALLTALSRSGLLGAAAGLVYFIWLSRRRISRSGRASLLAGVAVVIAVAATYANLGALADRVGETLAVGVGGRRTIWRDTWPMVRDFFVTGIGAGAYQRGMLVYQQSKGLFYFNHAHDEYLQLAAEGGVMLAVPAAIVLIAGAWRITQRLRADHAPMFWIRVGATSGLVAVAVQSIWDTGLRMPANAVLFAVLAALALHAPDSAGDSQQATPNDRRV